MRKSFKAIICAASAAVVCAAPTVTTFAGVTANTAITAEAASETYDTAYHFATIDGRKYVYANGLIYQIYKPASTPSSVGELKIVGVHPSAAGKNYTLKTPTYIKYEFRRYDIIEIDSFDYYTKLFSNNNFRSFSDSLKSLDLTNSTKLNKIHNAAFYNIKSLTDVKLPSTITYLGSNAFQNTGLKSIDLSYCKGITHIYGYLFANTPLQSITIPSNVTYIYDGAFKDCTLLKTVSFASNSNLKTIYQNAFKNTAITEVSIPSTVTDIKAAAFLDCNALSKVTFLGSNSNSIRLRTYSFTKSKGINKPLTIYNYRSNVQFERNVFGYTDAENKIANVYGTYRSPFSSYVK